MLGATPTNRSLGAAASRAMFGNLTSRLVPHPRFFSSKKRLASRLLNFWRFFGVPLKSKTEAHPRRTIPAALTSAICQARASWLLNDTAHQAVFPKGPDWTLLVGSGSDLPQPTQGKTLTVLEVDNLSDPISKFDGNVQTLGLAMADPEKERELALLAGRRGVDRIVKLGRMHVFVPPWDGVDLIRPMVRMVRHVCSTD